MAFSRKITIPMVILLICHLTGCGGVSECNDTSIKETVLNLVDKEMTEYATTTKFGSWYQNAKPSFSDIKVYEISTSSKDDELGKRSCSAKYGFTYKDKEYSEDIVYKLKYIEDEDDTMVSLNIERIKLMYWFAVHPRN